MTDPIVEETREALKQARAEKEAARKARPATNGGASHVPPGLEWRTLKSGMHVATWIASVRGYKPERVQLLTGLEPTEQDRLTVVRECERLQREMLAWERTQPNSDRPAPEAGKGLDQQGDIDPVLAEMNEKYAVVQIGGKTRVMGFEDDPTYPGCQIPVFQTIADFKAFHDKHKIKAGKKKVIGRGKWWIAHSERRQYEAVVYAPRIETGDKVYNLWQGFTCKPKEGDCFLFIDHVRENVCRGNPAHYTYLLNKLAYGVQRPDKNGEVAVVLRGKEGVGKGKLVLTYGSLFGSHFKHISNPRHLVGNFNSLQHDCSVLFGDEVFFAGDRTHEGILKAIITEPTLQIERKGIDTFTAPNRMHIFLSSNNDWVVPAGADARRFFVLDVGDDHKQDHAYFAAIDKEMENGGREALLHLLLNLDLTHFEVRNVPKTAALADQKQRTRRGIDALIEYLANEGQLPEQRPGPEGRSYPDAIVASERQDRKGFFKVAQSIAPDLKHLSWIVVQKSLKEDWGCTKWESHGLCGLTFLPLGELRKRFEEKHGEQQWDPVDNWLPS